MPVEREKLSKIIKITCKDFTTTTNAINYARTWLHENNYRPTLIEGFIYLDGEEVSDLLIIEPIPFGSSLKNAKIRACTHKEHQKFLYEFLWVDMETRKKKWEGYDLEKKDEKLSAGLLKEIKEYKEKL